MQLLRVDDPRDNLHRMTRDELWNLACAHGVQDKFPFGRNTMHSDETNLNRPNMVAILRALGIKGPDLSHRVIGQPIDWHEQPAVKPPERSVDKTEEISALVAQRAAQPKKAAKPDFPIDKPVEEMTIQELRRHARHKGVKWSPRDKAADIKAKLLTAESGNGEQDATRRSE